jgi:hypothetical protein
MTVIFPDLGRRGQGRKWSDDEVLRFRLLIEGRNLNNADLSGADLRRAYLRRAYLAEADLAGADLTEANLLWARLRGAKADEEGAKADEDTIWPEGFDPEAAGVIFED